MEDEYECINDEIKEAVGKKNKLSKKVKLKYIKAIEYKGRI